MEKKEEKDIGITVKKSENFSEWYTQVIIKSGFVDYTEVSGCIAFRPDGYALWENIQEEVDKRLKKIGIKNVYFPLFIPEKFLKKEAAHVEGFAPEVAWVTYSGSSKLSERLAIRPTSESIMYPSYAKWIRSYRDLPMRFAQWNSVVRWEFKHPIPLLRSREFLWVEGHTVFANKKDAEDEMKEIIRLWEDFSKEFMALPYLTGEKSRSETFAGAEYTWTLEHYLPNGKAIQGPDAHFDGQNFSKAFDIVFLDENEKKKYAYQNTWAITTRMIGVFLAVHGDDKGLIVPPYLAPTQAVIVPIYFKDKEAVLKQAEKIKQDLGSDFKIRLDDREGYTPGWKFNEWELKGVPVRIEIGPKDIEKSQVVLVRRDNGEKIPVPVSDLKKKLSEVLQAVHDNLYAKAKKLLEDNIVETRDWAEFMQAIKDKKLVYAPWCGETECEDWIKDKTGGAKTLNRPLNLPKKIEEKCPKCGKPAKFWFYFGRSY
jgi:prolyl-tRNA synthetase